MAKPQPKKEIVCEVIDIPNLSSIYITAITADAVAWLEKVAPQYGGLYTAQSGDSVRFTHHLSVHPNYDAQEVATYLESMSDE